ncbi:hypothetical protein SERLA73DRAFT_150187 [Serpula lacrymans var. lacrymans S7.3]|uniref:Uncharacterized protein n=1 Tax=Serpula lacrymans var. lacrymans (strain S7.3) TaxID=936435 RepID=F8PLE6_SERL3|nr:hypothetical protein SERLA73DRAFT_150187 [Serpula lacrymans var. lacrymans S7.3]
MPKCKLKQLTNLGGWSNFKGALHRKKSNKENKENIPPSDTMISPPASPQKKRCRLFRAISTQLALFTSQRANSPAHPTIPEVSTKANLNIVQGSEAAPTVPMNASDDHMREMNGCAEAVVQDNASMMTQVVSSIGVFEPPPSIKEATLALDDLKTILRPPRHSGRGYKDPEFDLLFCSCLEGMQQFLWIYVGSTSEKQRCWQAASSRTAKNLEKGPYYARRLQDWIHGFINDCEQLPVILYGTWNESILRGWLRSPNGKEQVCVVFKADKNCEGKQSNGYCGEHYPDKEHIFVYNNAKTHLKRANSALSARHMPKFASKPDSNWGIDVNVRDDNGKPVYSPNGKPSKTKVHMEGATFADGTKQSLYFEPGHPQAGFFKGMAIILSERGFVAESNFRAQCPDFKLIDAYKKGLNGKQAGWASKKYHGHCVLPVWWMNGYTSSFGTAVSRQQFFKIPMGLINKCVP